MEFCVYDVVYQWWDNLAHEWKTCVTTMHASGAYVLGRMMYSAYQQWHEIRPVSISFGGVCLKSWSWEDDHGDEKTH